MANEICWSFEGFAPRICIFVTILAYIMFGNDIDAKTAYIVTAYYNVLRSSLYRTLPLSKLFLFMYSNNTITMDSENSQLLQRSSTFGVQSVRNFQHRLHYKHEKIN